VKYRYKMLARKVDLQVHDIIRPGGSEDAVYILRGTLSDNHVRVGADRCFIREQLLISGEARPPY